MDLVGQLAFCIEFTATRGIRKHDLDNARKVCQKYERRRFESRGHTCIDSSPNSSYGPSPAEPDIPVNELLQLCKEHLDQLNISSEDIDNIIMQKHCEPE